MLSCASPVRPWDITDDPMSQVLAHLPLPADAFPDVDGRLPYRPYEKHHTGKQKMVLDLVGVDGTTDSLYYPYMLRVRYTPPRLLSVVYFDGVFILTGRDLVELRALLRDYVVSE